MALDWDLNNTDDDNSDDDDNAPLPVGEQPAETSGPSDAPDAAPAESGDEMPEDVETAAPPAPQDVAAPPAPPAPELGAPLPPPSEVTEPNEVELPLVAIAPPEPIVTV